MSSADFPPFPTMGEQGPHVCEAVRFYMAIIDDLSSEQKHILTNHIQQCKSCAPEFRMLQRATRLLATLPASSPSEHVDAAILAALHRTNEKKPLSSRLQPQPNTDLSSLSQRRRRKHRWSGPLGLVAAVLLLTIIGVLARSMFFPTMSSQAFTIPSTISWSSYVLHYTQQPLDTHGNSYQIDVYQDLGADQMHVESTMEGKFDVVVVSDSQQMLGKDMVHHVAELGTGVELWFTDGSEFDLQALRQDLQSQRAVYLGKTSFQGQNVYQIRTRNGEILLLDMHYLPVNVLSSNKPLYVTFKVMNNSQVPESTWDMQVPSGFHMGRMPSKS